MPSAAVIGGGTMGTGIARALARAGTAVTLVEVDPVRLAAAVARVGEPVAAAASIDAVPLGVDAIVEAVPEDPALKRAVLAACEAREPRLLATNTSSISIAELATGLAAPERFIGLHFFNPVHAMQLVEVVVGPQTSEATRATALALCERLGKTSIVVNDAPGFATSRLGIALGLEAMRMVEEGIASPADIDRAMELGYRHPMGPLKLTDLVGLDVRLAIARNLQRAYGARYAPPQLLVDMVARGKLGKKSGVGFYDWRSGEPRPLA